MKIDLRTSAYGEHKSFLFLLSVVKAVSSIFPRKQKIVKQRSHELYVYVSIGSPGNRVLVRPLLSHHKILKSFLPLIIRIGSFAGRFRDSIII